MYDTMKIEWKIAYIRCIKSFDLYKNSNSLYVQYHENRMENFVH